MTGSPAKTSWNDRSEEDRQRLETAFGALHSADLWLDNPAGERADAARVPMPVLYAAATNPTTPLPATLVGRIATDPRLKADFNCLIERVSQCSFGRAAAASSGVLEKREAKGYTIRIKPSRADENQVYILIDLPEHGSVNAPAVLMLRTADGSIHKLALGAAEDGTIRVLSTAESDEVKALGDPATEIDLI